MAFPFRDGVPRLPARLKGGNPHHVCEDIKKIEHGASPSLEGLDRNSPFCSNEYKVGLR
jgi:hypothetical protein